MLKLQAEALCYCGHEPQAGRVTEDVTVRKEPQLGAEGEGNIGVVGVIEASRFFGSIARVVARESYVAKDRGEVAEDVGRGITGVA